MRERLRGVLDSTESLPGRIFAYSIQALILLSLVTFSISTLPNLGDATVKALRYFEVVTVAIFTVEYALRIYASKQPAKFIFSFYGLIDLIAILPFYLSTGLDLRALRSFRLLRVFRILKLLKYNQAINRFQRALTIAKEELILFGFVSLILLYLSAVGIYYFEYAAQPEVFKSVFHSLWWAVTTLTTVGYGDMYPITLGGKIFTFFILMIGLGIIAVPTALIASALSQTLGSDDRKSPT